MMKDQIDNWFKKRGLIQLGMGTKEIQKWQTIEGTSDYGYKNTYHFYFNWGGNDITGVRTQNLTMLNPNQLKRLS